MKNVRYYVQDFWPIAACVAVLVFGAVEVALALKGVSL